VFISSHRFLAFDQLRVPYDVGHVDAPSGFGALQFGKRRILWPLGRTPADPTSIDDAVSERRGEDVVLSLDPNARLLESWSESYGGDSRGGGVKRAAMHAYYRVRPALPRPVQISARRAFSRIQARRAFPRWPVETSLHDLLDRLLTEAASLAGEPVPWIAPWPQGRDWTLVLTHDVERSGGYENIDILAEVETETGFRSSWNLVPERDYEVSDVDVQRLWGDGFEVGVHGLRHDGRDLESAATVAERLPKIREYAERWGAVGFRSPATHRDWDLMPRLGFEYDSSYPDTDPFEPMGGGCCSWWPYFIDDLVELPITLTQDHTAFVILRRGDESLWVEKTEFLRDRGGLAVLITHPDYMLSGERVESYRRFLERYAEDPSAWRALPRDVAAWWRRRAATVVERSAGGWSLRGPAAEEATLLLASR
jgi:hypothetical protein